MIRRISQVVTMATSQLNETGANSIPPIDCKMLRTANTYAMASYTALKRCWEQRVHAGSLYQKLCCGVLHRSIHRSHRRQSAVTCSADREPPAWSWPSASQVSWLIWRSLEVTMVTSEDRVGCKLANIHFPKCRWQKMVWSTIVQIEEMLVARGHTKIEKVTLDDLKLTAIFSKRRKIGASWHETCAEWATQTREPTIASSEDRDGCKLTTIYFPKRRRHPTYFLKCLRLSERHMAWRMVGPKADKNSGGSRIGLPPRGIGVVFN